MDSEDFCTAQLGWRATGRGDGNYVAPLCDVRPHPHVSSPLHVYRHEDIARGSVWGSRIQILNVPRYKE